MNDRRTSVKRPRLQTDQEKLNAITYPTENDHLRGVFDYYLGERESVHVRRTGEIRTGRRGDMGHRRAYALFDSDMRTEAAKLHSFRVKLRIAEGEV